MLILGISAYYHDSAAALVQDGEIIAAAQEERFTRKKHDNDFPAHAIQYCVNEAGLDVGDLDNIVFYDKPFLKFERLLEIYLDYAPQGIKSFLTAMPVWLKEKLFQKRILTRELQKIDERFSETKLLFFEHHLSHAASAFFPSPFEKAMILTMDGVGEWATSSVMVGEGSQIRPIKEIHFPHSLGLLYSAFTYFTGFKVNSGEYKLMGLAPYGRPIYADRIREHLIDIKNDGSFMVNMEYFDYCTGLTMTNNNFNKLFNREPRQPGQEITQMDMDLASSIQDVTEEVIMKIATSIRDEYNIPNLCLAGGVALNCVANGAILRSGLFDRIWIQPASGDAGGALGAALAAYHLYHDKPRSVASEKDKMQGSYLGPAFSNEEIKNQLAAIGAIYEELPQGEVIDKAVKALANEKVIGWFQGRMEYGPRALGARSILGDPRSAKTQSTMNLKIKYRESFRPFAPSVLDEEKSTYFELDTESPYMLLVAPVTSSRRLVLRDDEKSKFGLERLNIPKSDIPAVTHVDYTARIQTVHRSTNRLYYELISRFKELTGYGLVVNTSFNVRGEPIVCTPEDAFNCFMGTEMDELFIGNFHLNKKKQDMSLRKNYADAFEPD